MAIETALRHMAACAHRAYFAAQARAVESVQQIGSPALPMDMRILTERQAVMAVWDGLMYRLAQGQNATQALREHRVWASRIVLDWVPTSAPNTVRNDWDMALLSAYGRFLIATSSIAGECGLPVPA